MSLSPPFLNPTLPSSPDRTDRIATVSGTSPAKLNLQRLYAQSLRGAPAPKDNATKPADATASGAPAKGKPRLLLMGQRRYVTLPSSAH